MFPFYINNVESFIVRKFKDYVITLFEWCEFNVGKSATNRMEFCLTVVAPLGATAAAAAAAAAAKSGLVVVSGLDVEIVGLVDDDVVVDGLRLFIP